MNGYDRDELASKFFDAVIDRTDVGGMLELSQTHGAEVLAEHISKLAFALADAMIAKSQAGESK